MHLLKSLFVILLISWATVLTSDAQTSVQSPFYRFVLKGQPSPYDSGVITRIDRYRKEGILLRRYHDHVDSLVLEISKLSHQNSEQMKSAMAAAGIITQHEATIARKDSVGLVYKQNFDSLVTTVQKQGDNDKLLTWGLVALIALNVLQLLFN